MKIHTLFLCVLMFAVAAVQSQEQKRRKNNLQLNKEEEECLAKTGVSRPLVLQDKGYHVAGKSEKPEEDPKFMEYLECYRQQLDRLGKLVYTKDKSVAIPGYTTRATIPGIYCTENDLSGKAPPRNCILRE